MMRHCSTCHTATEHRTGTGFTLPGRGNIDLQHNGPHCMPCLERLFDGTLDTPPPKPTAPVPEDVVMPFGKYQGHTLGQIADDDLLYLDWLAGADIRSKRLQQAVWDICTRRTHEIQSLIEERDR